ncbi:proteasome component pts1 [Coniophora puteana RWD-64-598 SS2]|uniref:Proteasome subunit beta n=1 Tax=Coniophora puteana (strain RWD-64-598) TaxID=741705 RepID=A0A5M3MFB9_CONPW|nr:proteasome component pts1 [Coniophora puteana RWD-64-598 SS2]EIW77959.1 proteasome component pts1 [Coniophora puteana RWD-64-598 SS2]
MNAFVDRFANSSSVPGVQMRSRDAVPADSDDLDNGLVLSAWGSEAGFGNIAQGAPTFSMPLVIDPAAFLRLHTDDHADPSCRIKLAHGTTTIAFKYQGGVIVAADARATMGSYIGSGTVKKIIEINPYLLGTMAGGGGDCSYWETYLGMHCRLHELRNHERISVAAASKYLSNLLYSYKGTGLSVNTPLIFASQGPAVYYVDADGTRMKGDLFSVGSGSTFAYGVLDQGYRSDLSDAEAYELARRSIHAAGHRDAFSGNQCNVYHVKQDGWTFIGNYDLSELHYEGVGNSGGYGYEMRTAGQSSSE